MATHLTDYHTDLCNSVKTIANVKGIFVAEAFFEFCGDILMESAETDSAEYTPYVDNRGTTIVDGFGGDPRESDGVLSLISGDFAPSETIEPLTRPAMNSGFDNLKGFIPKSLDKTFRESLTFVDPGYSLADTINTSWSGVKLINLIIVTNRKLNTSALRGRPAEEIDGTLVVFNVWDIERLHRYEESGNEREDTVIDLNEFGGPIPALKVSTPHENYDAYLSVISGPQLASIYEKFRAKLLESNVRLFLQYAGAVNKGIRSTIQNEPHMFFAYNNGITATAEQVETEVNSNGTFITSLTNFQIVNGGQTTAAIFAESKNSSVDLSSISLQMKLAVVEPARSATMVQNISRYANSQNKVNTADFFSNHRFHQWFENMSRNTWAPSSDGTFQETHWFYERARGQYRDGSAYKTAAEKGRFENENPKSQMIPKTDLGKFLNVWLGKPDLVSKGAQYNFASFAEEIKIEWEEDRGRFNVAFYQECIAKAIIFKQVEKLVPKQDWYPGGYRANIVAYAIAKLAHVLEQAGLILDFEAIWRSQQVPDGLLRLLAASGEAVASVITQPPSTTGNPSQWAKRKECWENVQALIVDWPVPLDDHCITRTEYQARQMEGANQEQLENRVDAQGFVFETTSEDWQKMKNWAELHDPSSISKPELQSIELAMNARKSMPSPAHCLLAQMAVSKLADAGCPAAQERLSS